MGHTDLGIGALLDREIDWKGRTWIASCNTRVAAMAPDTVLCTEITTRHRKVTALDSGCPMTGVVCIRSIRAPICPGGNASIRQSGRPCKPRPVRFTMEDRSEIGQRTRHCITLSILTIKWRLYEIRCIDLSQSCMIRLQIVYHGSISDYRLCGMR